MYWSDEKWQYTKIVSIFDEGKNVRYYFLTVYTTDVSLLSTHWSLHPA